MPKKKVLRKKEKSLIINGGAFCIPEGKTLVFKLIPFNGSDVVVKDCHFQFGDLTEDKRVKFVSMELDGKKVKIPYYE